ncbi:MAG: oxidoreductase, 2OG-Fe(II) oxygenase family [Planctomycetaceae bacterium]|nr:oxidoreductase, 2OG-Fe(II) oxygenase family [Planctomycetaceae bacterium]
MNTLFPITVLPADLPSIPGLQYLPEFVTTPEELHLASAVDTGAWDTSWERRRQPFGANYSNNKKSTDEHRAIPKWADFLLDRLQLQGIAETRFDQMLVNEYKPGQGIALHQDYPPFDRKVVSLSLLAPCVMEFRQPADGRRETLLLERRSLLVLSDEARYEWQHGIARRKSDRWKGVLIPRARRISITFRILKK